VGWQPQALVRAGGPELILWILVLAGVVAQQGLLDFLLEGFRAVLLKVVSQVNSYGLVLKTSPEQGLR